MEHADRELKTLQNLEKLLISEGYSVLILSIPFGIDRIIHISARNIVFPFAISSQTYPLRLIRHEKFKASRLYCLNWEQRLSRANENFKKPKDSFVKNRIIHFTWDKNFKKFLMKSGVDAQNIKIVGSPTIALMAEELGEKKKGDENSCNSQTFFFPMNYGWAFLKPSQIEKKVKQGYNKDHAWDYHKFSKACFEEFIKFINELLKKRTKAHIIIRPHPAVSVKSYIEPLKQVCSSENFSRIQVTKDKTIIDHLKFCDVVCSSWSTTVYDAINLEKKGCLFLPFPMPSFMSVRWMEQVPTVRTVEEFEDIIDGKSKFSPDVYPESVFENMIMVFKENHDLLVSEIAEETNNWSVKDFLYFGRSILRRSLVKLQLEKFLGDGLMRDYYD